MPTLGQRLTTALIELNELILYDNRPAEQARLEGLHKGICRRLQKLVDNRIPTNTVKYRDATEALKEANSALKKAREDAAKVAQAIEKLAKALQAIGKVAGALA